MLAGDDFPVWLTFVLGSCQPVVTLNGGSSWGGGKERTWYAMYDLRPMI
jgi:hypothetical protein